MKKYWAKWINHSGDVYMQGDLENLLLIVFWNFIAACFFFLFSLANACFYPLGFWWSSPLLTWTHYHVNRPKMFLIIILSNVPKWLSIYIDTVYISMKFRYLLDLLKVLEEPSFVHAELFEDIQNHDFWM